MSAMAGALAREEVVNVANYFASMPLKANAFVPDGGKIVLSKAKAEETLCSMRHLAAFLVKLKYHPWQGNNMTTFWSNCATLKAEPRTNDACNMTSVAETLSDADIASLAHYVVSLR